MAEISMSWTGERIELLKKLWSDGLSASRIATDLGGVSRNAVIGKVHRLGLSGRGRGDQAFDAASPAPEAAKAPVPADASLEAVRAGAAQAIAQSRMAVPAPTAPAPVRLVEAVVIPITGRVTIMELREQMCRWPLGDPARADFRFCGARSGLSGPYCAAGSTLAYLPVLDRRRDRRAAGA